MSDCSNCSNLQAEIRRLRTENNHLKKLIATVAAYAYRAATDSANKMKGHLPRATWSYLKARYELGAMVYNKLRGE